MFNSINDAVFVCRNEKNFNNAGLIAVNHAACEWLGYTEEELIKMSLCDLDACYGKKTLTAILNDVLKGKNNIVVETLLRAKNGRILPVEMSARPFEKLGKPAIIAVARDLSARKSQKKQMQNQAALKELRARLWKMAADRTLSETQLIQGLIDMIGRFISCERVIFAAFEGGEAVVKHEWKNKKARGSALGLRIPGKYYEILHIEKQKIVGIETILDCIPDALKKPALFFLKKLIKKLGGTPSIFTSCYVNGKLEGVVSCAINLSGRDSASINEIESALMEAASIISNALEARRAEERLNKIAGYRELRTGLWRLAAEKNIPEKVLLGSMLEMIGTALEAERITFSVVRGEELALECGWKKKGLPALRGVNIRRALFYKLDLKQQTVIEKNNFAKMFPRSLRTILKAIIKEAGDRDVLLTPVYISGKREGVISCSGKKESVALWPDEKKALIVEAALIMTNVIERRRADGELQESELRYRSLFEGVNDAVTLIAMEDGGRHYKFIEANPAACTMIGFSRDEMLSMTPYDVEVPGNSGHLSERIKELLKRKTIVYENVLRSKDGRDINVEINSRVYYHNGAAAIFSVIRDISDRKRAEEKAKNLDRLNGLKAKMWELASDKTLDENMLLHKMLALIGTGFQVDRAILNRLEPDGSLLAVAEWKKDAAFSGLGFRTPANIAGIILKKGIFEANPDNVWKVLPGLERDTAGPGVDSIIKKFNPKGIIVLPFRPDGKPEGVISFGMHGSYDGYYSWDAEKKGITKDVVNILSQITGRIRAEKRTGDSEELYRTLVGTSPDAVIMMSLDGRMTFASDRMAEILGYEDAGKLPGINSLDLVSYEDKKKVACYYLDSVKNGSIKPVEFTALRKDGAKFICEMSASFLKNAGGRPKAVIATVRDVTERKMANDALKESEEKFRTVIEHTGHMVYDYNVGMGSIEWTGVVTGKTGYTIEEFNREVGIKEWENMIHPDDREQAFSGFEKALRECGKYNAEYRFRMKNGQYMYMEDSGVFIPDKSGKACKMLGVMKDVTERKNAELAVKESEEKFRTFSEKSILGMFIIQDGFIKYHNKAFIKINGYDMEEIERWGKDGFLNMVHPDDRAAVAKMAENRQAGLTGDANSYELKVVTKAGSIKWFDVYAKSVIYEGGYADFVTEADITRLKDAEEKLKLTIRELESSNAELEQFAYIASHDLQEPLRMVSSYVSLLQKRYMGKLDSDADDFIKYAVDGADRMSGLIKDLLSFSRVGTHKKEFVRIDMNNVMNIIKSNLEKAVSESKAEVVYGTLPEITADETQMIQLVQNLVSNGIKFSRKDVKPRLEISAKKYDGMVVFAFKDNGIGIKEKYFDKMFVIFQRLNGRSEYPGNGIGLAVCKKIVESHGGRIWLESEYEKGTTFFFSIPAGEK
jgi:PAS domain S-box-containing protein